MLRESLSFVLRLIFPCVGICYRRARGTSPASPCPASAYQASPYPESPYQASPYQASPYQPGPPQQGPPLYVCLKDIEGGPNNDNHLNSINISSPYRQIPKAREQPTNLETRAVNQWLQAIDSSSHWSLGESHLSASEHTQASLQASSDPPQEGLLQLDQKTRTELSAAPTQNPPPTTTTVQSFICSTCSRQFLRRSLLTKHTKTHTRPFKCNEQMCRNAPGFALSKDLRRHTLSVHEKSTTIKCLHQGCNETFSRKDNHRRHMKQKHCVDTA